MQLKDETHQRIVKMYETWVSGLDGIQKVPSLDDWLLSRVVEGIMWAEERE